MSYIDGFVIAVPTANKEKFIAHARQLDPIFLELGALRVIEAWGDDVADGKLTDFRRAVSPEHMVFGRRGLGGPQLAEVDRMLADEAEHARSDGQWTAAEERRLTGASLALDAAFRALAAGSGSR